MSITFDNRKDAVEYRQRKLNEGIATIMTQTTEGKYLVSVGHEIKEILRNIPDDAILYLNKESTEEDEDEARFLLRIIGYKKVKVTNGNVYIHGNLKETPYKVDEILDILTDKERTRAFYSDNPQVV